MPATNHPSSKPGKYTHEELPVFHSINVILGRITEFMEIVMAIIVLIGFIFNLIPLAVEMPGLLSSADGFHEFLSYVLNLVIGIEFIRMLIRHTPDSVLEVLMFAIARHVILESAESIDLLIGVLALAVIFLIRKVLSSRAPYLRIFDLSSWTKDGEDQPFD